MDMSVPAHVHDDTHAVDDDEYEEYTADNYQKIHSGTTGIRDKIPDLAAIEVPNGYLPVAPLITRYMGAAVYHQFTNIGCANQHKENPALLRMKVKNHTLIIDKQTADVFYTPIINGP